MSDDKTNNIGNGFSVLNGLAMSDGLLLGAFGLMTFAAGLLVLPWGMSGLVGMAALVGWILLLCFCSKKRSAAFLNSGYDWSFGRAYIHSLLVEFFASAWVAIAVYVWFRYFDKGYFADSMIALAKRPEMQQAIAEMDKSGVLSDFYLVTGTDSFDKAIETFCNIPPETYCGMVVSWTLVASPVIALLIALICKKYR